MSRHFRFPTGVLALMLAAVLATAGCEGLQKGLETAADIIEQNPELIKNEEDREKWVSGAGLVKSLVDEIDTGEEIAIGQSLAVRAFASFGKPHPDDALQRYVTRVGKLVALQSDRPSLPYSFAVVQNDVPNALALPGGFVFVSTGLLKRLGSESELACVLGHEICHVAQRHGIEIVGRDRVISRLVRFGEALDEDVGKYRQFIDQTYVKLTTEGYDRNYEWIADKAGTEYAYRAGYHPEGLLPFLRAAPKGFEAYKTHPDPSVRINKVLGTLSSLGGYAGMPKLEDRYARNVLSRLR